MVQWYVFVHISVSMCQYTGSVYGSEKEAATAHYEKKIASKLVNCCIDSS